MRSHHVEHINGFSLAENAGRTLRTDELLLIGRAPELSQVRDPRIRSSLESLLADGRSLASETVATPDASSTQVSAAQVAIWFAGGALMAASIGSWPVSAQGWAQPGIELSRWPGVALPELTTLWLPPTQGARGAGVRWRVALAWTGPHALSGGRASPASPDPLRTSVPDPDAFTFGEKQRIVVAERFQDWLSFPARTTRPAIRKLRDRPAEDRVTRDARLKRLESLAEALARHASYTGVADERMVAALVGLGHLGPGEVGDYRQFADLDVSLLRTLGVLAP